MNEGRTYCRKLPLEHSAILLTCIAIIGRENQFTFAFLRVAVLGRFYCVEVYLYDYPVGGV